MRISTVSPFKSSLLVGCVVAAALGSQGALAGSPGVFSSFSGDWKGVGSVVDANGKTEPLRCRETNVVSDDNISMAQSLICASDSYRMEFHTTLFTDGRTIRGTWEDTTRNTGGNVHGQIANDTIAALITAPGFSAQLSARTNADRQEVMVLPQGTTINKVVVTMKR